MTNSVRHLGIIMDGNRRWAARRGLPASLGHRAGAAAARKVVESLRRREIPFVTLYAFSSDNWRRSSDEVSAIFGVLDGYLDDEIDALVRQRIRVQVIGRRDRLPERTRRRIELAEARTASGGAMLLRLAVDYSSRDAIVAAAHAYAERHALGAALDRDGFARLLGEVTRSPAVPDIDLMIRTSGEQRLSDFCLWECAYAELCFSEALWPDFGETALTLALDAYAARQRRFGGTWVSEHELGETG
jgi:undecaprenyl diphosphate synthase